MVARGAQRFASPARLCLLLGADDLAERAREV
jgi:hypothetical protein